MDWWVWGVAALLLLAAYVTWLAGRLGRLHRRADSAAAALDASLARRAAAAALLADELAGPAPAVAAELHAAARAALEAASVEREAASVEWGAASVEREAAENDLTQALRRLPAQPAPQAAPSWSSVVTTSRRVGLARQVHTDLVRDALALRRRMPVRVLGLARRHPEPAYFDVGDPGLDGATPRPGGNGTRPPEPAADPGG